MLSRVWRSLIRIGSFFRKELVEIFRQPRLVVTLVLGPFFILLAFGAGLRDEDPPVRTVFVTPEDSALTEQVEQFADAQSERLTVVDVTGDEDAAMRRLRRGDVEMVMIFPEDAAATVRSDQQAEVRLFHDVIDPIETQAIQLFTRTAVDEVNKLVLRELVAEGQSDAEDVQAEVGDARDRVAALREGAQGQDDVSVQRELELLEGDVAALALLLGPTVTMLESVDPSPADPDGATGLQETLSSLTDRTDRLTAQPDSEDLSEQELDGLETDLATLEEGLAEFTALSPGVIVSPFEGTASRVIPGSVNLTDYYAPAVVALLLQHLVVTFVGLSVVREEQLGTTELFRVAPLSTFETLFGKYLAYIAIGAFVAALLAVGLVFGLGLPMHGSWWMVAFILAAVLLASTGLGFVIALLAESDSQAVQYAMMILLASIFFSGFLLSLSRFLPWLSIVSWFLPVTHGIELLRDEMLRGATGDELRMVALGVMAVVLFVAGWMLLRRRLRSS